MKFRKTFILGMRARNKNILANVHVMKRKIIYRPSTRDIVRLLNTIYKNTQIKYTTSQLIATKQNY